MNADFGRMNADFENQFVLIKLLSSRIAKNAKSKRTKPNKMKKIANKAKCRQVDDIRSLSSDLRLIFLNSDPIQSENFRNNFSKNRNQKVL